MQKIMYPAAVNSRQTELSAAIDAVQMTVPLVDASVVPPAPNLLTIGTDESAETILYTGKTGNNLTGVTRGFQGTAQSWALGSKVARYFTAYDHDSFVNNVGDLQTSVAEAATKTELQTLDEEVTAQLADIANPPRARYSSDVQVELTPFVWGSPQWNIKVYDTDNIIDQTDNTKIHITKSGTYLIQAMVSFEAVELGARNLKILRNGDVNDELAYSSNPGSANTTRCNVSTTAYFNAGEYAQILGYQDDYPNPRHIIAGRLSIIRLSPP